MDKQNNTNDSGFTDSNYTNPWDSAEYWGTTLKAIDVILITLLVLVFWLLICFIIYGTKANRWRNKPGSSSLSSGASYVLCTIAVFSTIPFLGLVEVLNHHSNLSQDTDICKALADGAAVANFSTIYATYLFLWFMQRCTYKHPYVRDRVNKRMDVFSVIYAIVLTASCAAGVALYNISGKYKSVDRICVYNALLSEKLLVTLGSGAVLGTMQIALIWSSIYTAVRARFPDNDRTKSTTTDIDSNNWKIFYRWFFPKDSKVYFSPVEITVRRSTICSIVIVVTDVVSIVYDAVLPIQFPVSLHLVGYGIGSTINVFCMVSIFGFSQKLLSLCCPKKLKVKKSNDVFVSSI